LLQFCLGQDAPIFLQALRQMQEHGCFDQQTLQVRRFSGGVVHVTLQGTAIHDQAERLVALGWLFHNLTAIRSAEVVTSHVNIAESKQTEKLLREAQERTESILSSVADTHILFDRQWRYLYVNTVAAHAIGRPREQILGRTLWELFPDIVGTELDRQYRRAMDESLSVAFDFHYASNDTWWHNRFYPAPEGLAVFATNITERKRVEEALRLYAERLEMLHQLDQAILAANSPVEIAEVALRRLRQLVPCQRSGIAVFGSEDRRATMLIIDSNGEVLIDPEIRLPPHLFGESGVTGVPEPLIVRDPPPVVQALLADGVRSYITVPLISQGELIGALNLGAGKQHAFTPAHLDIAREVADSVAIAIQQARLSEQISDGRARLRALARRLVEAQEAERRQLALELHDQVGQILTALNIGLSIAREHVPAESEATIGVRLDDSMRLITETMVRIRDIMAALRPAVLDDYGLAAALRWYTQQFSERTDIDVTLVLDEEARELRSAPEVETALFRTTQEALTNVIKHARVERAQVMLQTDAHTLRLTIDDDGMGFDPMEPIPAGEQHGLGLIGMRERVEAIGGRLELLSAPGQGTRIVVEVRR
jgi:PAS domain S-box-containing protein